MYCEKCRVLVNGYACPVCGSERIREPTASDLCFLVEKDQVWSGMLADVLQKKQIRFLRRGQLGEGLALKTGPLFERFRFYVFYSDWMRAAEVVEELFQGDPKF